MRKSFSLKITIGQIKHHNHIRRDQKTIGKVSTEGFLNKNNFKKTKQRLAILDILFQSNGPISVPEILKKIDVPVNETTVYRFLHLLVDQGLITKVDLGESEDYFEYQRYHHHHIVCKKCGKRESIIIPHLENKLNEAVQRKSREFSAINSHILDFFGLCKKCS